MLIVFSTHFLPTFQTISKMDMTNNYFFHPITFQKGCLLPHLFQKESWKLAKKSIITFLKTLLTHNEKIAILMLIFQFVLKMDQNSFLRLQRTAFSASLLLLLLSAVVRKWYHKQVKCSITYHCSPLLSIVHHYLALPSILQHCSELLNTTQHC